MASRVFLKAKGNRKAGKGSKATAPEERSAGGLAKESNTWAMKKAKVMAHYGFILVGMNSEPKPQLYKFLNPV